jgi:hypothetical protein
MSKNSATRAQGLDIEAILDEQLKQTRARVMRERGDLSMLTARRIAALEAMENTLFDLATFEQAQGRDKVASAAFDAKRAVLELAYTLCIHDEGGAD